MGARSGQAPVGQAMEPGSGHPGKARHTLRFPFKIVPPGAPVLGVRGGRPRRTACTWWHRRQGSPGRLPSQCPGPPAVPQSAKTAGVCNVRRAANRSRPAPQPQSRRGPDPWPPPAAACPAPDRRLSEARASSRPASEARRKLAGRRQSAANSVRHIRRSHTQWSGTAPARRLLPNSRAAPDLHQHVSPRQVRGWGCLLLPRGSCVKRPAEAGRSRARCRPRSAR